MKKRLPKGFYFDNRKQLYKLSFTFESERYSVYGRTQSECEEKKAAKLELLKNHMHIDNQKITLSQFYDTWITEQEKEVKPSTIYNYSKSWGYIESCLGKVKITDIQKSHVQKLQKAMLQEQKTADTINRATRLLKQILNSAINERIINFNPCNAVKNLKTERVKAIDSNHRALTTEETALFLETAAGSHYENLFRFLLLTGCRIGEATALSWFDINFKKQEININKTVSRISNKEFAVSSTPKTDCSKRTIPITKELCAILERQKEIDSMLFGSSNMLVFPNARGNLANYNSVNVTINHIISRIQSAGNPLFQPFSVHAFRDTFATRCIEQGMQPNTLKAIMGHSSLKMTMDLYAHVMPNTKREELERISLVI